MRDLAFFNAGCHEPRGARRAVVPFRRLVRRLLRPIFQRQVVLYQELHDLIDRLEQENRMLRSHTEVQLGTQVERLDGRHDALAAQMQTTIALGWDYVATVRRLAVLEDRVEALMAAQDEARPSIPFLAQDGETDTHPAPVAQSRAS